MGTDTFRWVHGVPDLLGRRRARSAACPAAERTAGEAAMRSRPLPEAFLRRTRRRDRSSGFRHRRAGKGGPANSLAGGQTRTLRSVNHQSRQEGASGPGSPASSSSSAPAWRRWVGPRFSSSSTTASGRPSTWTQAGVLPGSDSDKRELAKDVAAMANSAGAVILIGTVESEGISSEALAHPFTDEDELGYRQIVGPQAPRGGDLTPVGSRDRDCLPVAVLARRRAPLAFEATSSARF